MEGTIIRIVIPLDNSCLFNAVGYIMEHDKHKAPELRQELEKIKPVVFTGDLNCAYENIDVHPPKVKMRGRLEQCEARGDTSLLTRQQFQEFYYDSFT